MDLVTGLEGGEMSRPSMSSNWLLVIPGDSLSSLATSGVGLLRGFLAGRFRGLPGMLLHASMGAHRMNQSAHK